MDEKQLMKSELDRVSMAKSALMLDSPFFATLSLRLKTVADLTCPHCMGTDGVRLVINPTLTAELPKEEIVGVICHEDMHVATGHPFRMEQRKPFKWNMAADYAINPIVLDAGFKLPKGVLLKEEFRNQCAEWIYDRLPDKNGDDGDKDWNYGGIIQPTGESGEKLSPSEMQSMEMKWQLAVRQAAQIAKSQGRLPGGLEQFLDDLLDPVVPWKEVLARFLLTNARNDYTWRKPNSRYTQFGLYLPTLESPSLPTVVWLIDSSGSRDDEQLRSDLAEAASVLRTYQTTLIIIQVDAAVQKVDTIATEDIADLKFFKVKGRGGTDFRPGFEWLTENGIEPCCAIYMTDGECNSFPEPPDFPVLWGLTSNPYHWYPPFGESIQIRD